MRDLAGRLRADCYAMACDWRGHFGLMPGDPAVRQTQQSVALDSRGVPTWCDRLGQSICRRVSRRICSRAPSKALLGTGRLALLVVELGRVDINLFQQPVDLGLYPILTLLGLG